MSLYPVSNDWANRELRQSNNRLLKLNILQLCNSSTFCCIKVAFQLSLSFQQPLEFFFKDDRKNSFLFLL